MIKIYVVGQFCTVTSLIKGLSRKPIANSHGSCPMIAKGILTSWRRHISCTAGRRCPPVAQWGSLERCRRNKDLGRFWTYYLGGWYFLVLGVFGVRYFGVVSNNVSISVRLKLHCSAFSRREKVKEYEIVPFAIQNCTFENKSFYLIIINLLV